jgi:arylsulfatase A-like enzyme
MAGPEVDVTRGQIVQALMVPPCVVVMDEPADRSLEIAGQDVMPTVLALAGAKGSPDHPFDGKNIWPTLAENQPSPHEDILINVEPFRGAIRKGNWKLVKIALLPGKTELFDLEKDPGEKNNVAGQFPEIVRDLQARLVTYAKQMKPSQWITAQPAFLGAQGKTIFDPDFDIDDSGLPHEKTMLQKN